MFSSEIDLLVLAFGFLLGYLFCQIRSVSYYRIYQYAGKIKGDEDDGLFIITGIIKQDTVVWEIKTKVADVADICSIKCGNMKQAKEIKAALTKKCNGEAK